MTWRRTAQAAALAALLAIFLITALGYGRLPQTVATHFDLAGNPNAWGSKGSVLLLPIVTLVLWGLLGAVSKLPVRYWNFPVRVMERNLPRQIELTLTLISTLKLEIMLTMLYLQWAVIAGARGNFTLSPLFLPLDLFAIYGTIGIYFIYALRAR
ncbi:MAG: hypothetical protein DLM50_00720 [Candidatus Meridianibacter frigidus]|nr:MAG: hypothetical protein DLM50_00720 [Candidatus Eremiobacteraeota bacterium]